MAFSLTLAPQKRIFATFFLYALALGGIFSRLSEIQTKMGVAEGALGLALIGSALGGQVSLMFAGPMVEKLGHRTLILCCIPGIALLMFMASMAPSPLWLFIALFGAGLLVGSMEIVINVEADRVEHLVGRRVMNRAHAFWSLGFFSAGILGMGAAYIHLNSQYHMAIMAVLLTLATLLVLWDFSPAPARVTSESKAPRFVRPTSGILLLVAFTLSAMMLEGASIDWSVIYMRNVFGTPQFFNILAFAIGAFAQAIARYFADRFVDQFGPISVARGMILILGAGAGFVSFAPNPFFALLGFALIGIGSSGLFPLAMSAAAQRHDRPAATNVAALAQLSFMIFLLAPPLLGFVSEILGSRYAFGIGLPLVVVSWFTVSQLLPQSPRPGKEPLNDGIAHNN